MTIATSTWRVTRKSSEWTAKCGTATVRGDDEAGLRSAVRAHCLADAGVSAKGVLKAKMKREWTVRVVEDDADSDDDDIFTSLFD